MLTLVAFVVALGVLIAVHEWGHYRVAVACGVKVLRFSVGFGKPLLRWTPRRQRAGQDTEFAICLVPFGGYVKMLDEREAPVAPELRDRAFNTQPLRVRAAIVAAGPVANLLLAVLLYAAVNWVGVQEPHAVLAPPLADSIAAQAGLRGGETVQRAALAGDELAPVASFESLRWLLTRGALDGHDVLLEVADSASESPRELRLPTGGMKLADADATLFRRIGIVAPLTRPVIDGVAPGSAAQRAGLQDDDLVVQVGDTPITDGLQLRELIRASVRGDQGVSGVWQIERQGQRLTLQVQPDARSEGGRMVGRIGAYVGAPPEMVTVRHGPVDGLWRGVVRTWEVSALTLRTMGRMLIGQASLKNLSGPLTIAEFAGRAASLGLTYYLGFLALISVSLGVLNLLPVPVLDGGHLMYYLWEAATGKPVSDAWMERLQRGGLAILLAMMAIALFNDLVRQFG